MIRLTKQIDRLAVASAAPTRVAGYGKKSIEMKLVTRVVNFDLASPWGPLRTSGIMFPHLSGSPMDLGNLLNRTILPALNRGAVCGKPKEKCRKPPGEEGGTTESQASWQSEPSRLRPGEFRLRQ